MYNLVFRQACIMFFFLVGPASLHTLNVCYMFLRKNKHMLFHTYYTNDQRVVFECKGDVVPDALLTQSNVVCVTELTARSRQLGMCNTKFASFFGVISSDHRWGTQLPFLKSVTLEAWKELFHDKGVHCKSVEITDFEITMQLESYSNEIYTISVNEGEIGLISGKTRKTRVLQILLVCNLTNC